VTQMKITMAWRKMLTDGKELVTEKELRPLCKEIGKGYDTVIHYLQIHGYLERIFRGVFYVRSADEMERSYTRLDIHHMIARALELKHVRDWYFALETALKLNGMTHEYFALNSVVTGSYRTTKIIDIMGYSFRFMKWRPVLLDFGVVRTDGLRFTDPEKTILDMVYKRGYERGARGAFDRRWAAGLLAQYEDRSDRGRMRRYLKRYPFWMRSGMGDLL